MRRFTATLFLTFVVYANPNNYENPFATSIYKVYLEPDYFCDDNVFVLKPNRKVFAYVPSCCDKNLRSRYCIANETVPIHDVVDDRNAENITMYTMHYVYTESDYICDDNVFVLKPNKTGFAHAQLCCDKNYERGTCAILD